MNVLLYGGGPAETVYEEIIREVEVSTGMKINLTTMAFGEMIGKTLALSAAKSSSMDVYSTHFNVIATYIPHFEPLENYMSAADYMDFMQAGVRPMTFDGHLIALPRRFDARLMHYRTDLFEEAGIAAPPKTWEELVAIAQKLTVDANNDGIIDQYGLVIPGQGDPALRQFSDYLWQAGGDFLDEDYNPIFNSAEGVKGLTFYRDLLHKYKVVPPGVPGFGWAEVYQMFMGGTIAMDYGWPGVMGIYDGEGSSIVGKYGFASMPGDITTISTAVCHAYAINKYSGQKEAAWEFLKAITSTEAMVIENRATGSLPARKSAFAQVVAEASGRLKARFAALEEVILNGNAWPKIPEWAEISPIIWTELEAALIQTKPVDVALDAAAEAVRTILKDAGYYQ